jgi:DNA invertase Pin-like site-specific DNA recombinase
MTKAALQAKRARGEKTGGDVPYGYTVTHDGKLIEDAAEQRIIAYMRALAEGGVKRRQIALKLNAAGHRTKRGSSWSHVQISRILAREAAYKTSTPEAQ